MLGTAVDLGRITADTYVVGAVTDHICPWRACYPVVDLLGRSVQFVLSSQGHIQALINPSGNPKGSYRTTDAEAAEGADDSAGKPTADEWLERATEHQGSWWDHWVQWLEPRSGPRDARAHDPRQRRAPTDAGRAGHVRPGDHLTCAPPRPRRVDGRRALPAGAGRPRRRRPPAAAGQRHRRHR